MQGCERPQENKSYTEKTEQYEACGYAYKVVRDDGKVVGRGLYRGEKSVTNFLESIILEEEKIRKNFSRTKAAKRLGQI